MLGCRVIGVIALACLLLGSGGAVASGAAHPPARVRAGSQSRLGHHRFEALRRLYAAGVALESARGVTARDAARVRLLNACRALDRHDRLLGPLRRACLTGWLLMGEADDLGLFCQTREACASALGDLANLTGDLIDASRAGDAVIEAAHIAAGCKAALLTPKNEYEAFTAYRAAFGQLRRAVLSGSTAELAQAQMTLAGAAALGRDVPSVRQQFAAFRAACA